MANSKNPTPETGEGLLDGATGSQTSTTPPLEPAAENSAGTGKDGKSNPEQGKRKMGLVTFIQLAEPNKYVVSILKNKRGMEAHTKAEWEQIVNDLLKQKVS